MSRQEDGIWVIDENAKTIYISDNFAKVLRTSPLEMLEQPSFDYVFPEDLPAAEHLFDAKRNGSAHPFHFRLRRKDGGDLWVHVRPTPIHNAAGEFRGIVGTFSFTI